MAKKEDGFTGMLKYVLEYISGIVSSSVFSSVAEGTKIVMGIIEKRLLLLQRKMLLSLSSFVIMGFGALLLVFALFFFMIENLGWSYSAAFLVVGIIVIFTGIILKLGGLSR